MTFSVLITIVKDSSYQNTFCQVYHPPKYHSPIKATIPVTSAVSNMNVWIVALCEIEESKQVMRRLGMQRTHA